MRKCQDRGLSDGPFPSRQFGRDGFWLDSSLFEEIREIKKNQRKQGRLAKAQPPSPYATTWGWLGANVGTSPRCGGRNDHRRNWPASGRFSDSGDHCLGLVGEGYQNLLHLLGRIQGSGLQETVSGNRLLDTAVAGSEGRYGKAGDEQLVPYLLLKIGRMVEEQDPWIG